MPFPAQHSGLWTHPGRHPFGALHPATTTTKITSHKAAPRAFTMTWTNHGK